MELKSFIKTTLIDVITAIEETEAETKREVHIAKPQDNKTVIFDVAVTAETSVVGASSIVTESIIKVMGLDINANLGGEHKNGNVSRVSFGVYVASSTKEQTEKKRKNLCIYNKK